MCAILHSLFSSRHVWYNFHLMWRTFFNIPCSTGLLVPNSSRLCRFVFCFLTEKALFWLIFKTYFQCMYNFTLAVNYFKDFIDFGFVPFFKNEKFAVLIFCYLYCRGGKMASVFPAWVLWLGYELNWHKTDEDEINRFNYVRTHGVQQKCETQKRARCLKLI